MDLVNKLSASLNPFPKSVVINVKALSGSELIVLKPYKEPISSFKLKSLPYLSVLPVSRSDLIFLVVIKNQVLKASAYVRYLFQF